MPTNLDLITQKYSEGNLPRLEAERQLMGVCGFRSLEAHEYLNKIDRTIRALSEPKLPSTSTIPYSALPVGYYLEEQITTCYCGETQHHYRLYKEIRKDGGIISSPMGKSELLYDHVTIKHRQFHNGTPACIICVGTVKQYAAPPPPAKPDAILHTFKSTKQPKAAEPNPFSLSDLGLD